MATNRRISEFPEIAGTTIDEPDLLTLVHVLEVDPVLRNKKITFSGFKDYLNQYYTPSSGGVFNGNVIISGNLTVAGTTNVTTITGSDLATFSGVFVQNNLETAGTISGLTITGTNGEFTNLTAVSGRFTDQISGTTITGNTAGFAIVTGTTVTGTTASFTSLDVNGDINCDGVYGQTDTNTSINFPGSDIITFNQGGSEAARIDDSGELLVGTSNALTGTFTRYSRLVVQGNTAISTGFAILSLARGQTAAAIASADQIIGRIDFSDSGPGQFATISCITDAAVGLNNYPSRLVFSVTADGSASPTEALRIKNSGIINITNTPTYVDNAAAKTGGLVDGDVYRTSTGDLKIVYT